MITFIQMLGILLSTSLGGFVAPSSSPESAPEAPIQIELQAHPDEWARGFVIVRFRNASEDPIVILRPLDGSTWEWHLPIYRFHVVHESGEGLELGGRCGMSGLWHETTWPQDYFMRIPPGSTALTMVSLPFEIEHDVAYTVQLEYIVDPDLQGEQYNRHPLPEDAWVGAATSDQIVMRWDRAEARSRDLGALRMPQNMRAYRPPATPEAIHNAQERGLAALGELFEIPVAGRDQPALEKAQMLMLFWDGRGYQLESISQVLGEPSVTEPGAHEYLFENGVGWRFIAEDGIVTEVREIWPKQPASETSSSENR